MPLSELPGFAASLTAAILAGGVIGLEREWRGHAAGLRTHILVCLASALLMEAAVSQAAWRFLAIPGSEVVSDPTRMAHGVLTGIGFLCAGVIFRSGFSVHGLTTAASLWITSAIGILFGAGLTALAVTATALTAIVLVALRIVSRRLPARLVSDLEVRWSGPEAGRAVVETITQADADWRLARLEQDAETGVMRRSLRLQTKDMDALTALGERLSAIPGVSGWRIEPRDD